MNERIDLKSSEKFNHFFKFYATFSKKLDKIIVSTFMLIPAL